MESAQAKTLGLINKADETGGHQLQLWLSSSESGWTWTLRNAYMPGGRLTRSCVLDSGSHADQSEARRLGQECFDRHKTPIEAKAA